MTQKTVRIALAGACLMALTATACSSDDNGSSADTTPGGTVAPAATGAAPDVTEAATDAGGTTAAPSDTDAPTGAADLTISGNTFSAVSTTAGTEFNIINNDGVAHTVTADDGSFNVAIPAGGTAPLKIDTAGSYAIHCEIHSSMHGTITVA
jgi:plastocyanin